MRNRKASHANKLVSSAPDNTRSGSRRHFLITEKGYILVIVAVVLGGSLLRSPFSRGGGDEADGRTLFASAVSERLVNSINEIPSDQDMFCTQWDTLNIDEWWTHHPDYFLTTQNATHQCFRRDKLSRKAQFFRSMYTLQFGNSNCSKFRKAPLWSSGWGADLNQVRTLLMKSYDDSVPLSMGFTGQHDYWHYAAMKGDGSNPTCTSRDMECYFLPLSSCRSRNLTEQMLDENKPDAKKRYPKHTFAEIWWTYQFITRQKQWVRRAIEMNLAAPTSPKGFPKNHSCLVMHVRRGDVTAAAGHKRPYIPISIYFDLLPPERKQPNATILLLTDSSSAIAEAEEGFPDINWLYFNRERWVGDEGGFENQLPSKSPRDEVITILSTLKIVKNCNAIVRGVSNFGDIVHDSMQADQRITSYKVDMEAAINATKFMK